MTITLLHASDVHFGKPHRPRAARAFIEAAHDLEPDVIVISGDFTQRAKVGEYADARRFLAQLPGVPCVVTPGNHDVPLFRVWERALAPFKNYRRFLGPDLDTTTRIDGATLVALNSAAPRTAIVNGRITDRQVGYARQVFAEAPESDLRIAVIHHNLVQAPDDRADPVIRGSARLLRALAEMNVDILLGGHLHRGFVALYPLASASLDPMLIVMSGTTTSGRGREAERNRQSYNVVGIDDASIEVRRFLSPPQGGGFTLVDATTTPRRSGLQGTTGAPEHARSSTTDGEAT